MALKDIINTILSDAKKKAERIKEEAQGKIKEIDKESKVKAREEKEKVLAEAKKEEERIQDTARYEAKLLYRNELLAKKQELISRVFDQALDKLAKQPEDEYSELLVSLLKQAPTLKGKVEVLPARGKEKITGEAIKKAKKDFVLSDQVVEAKGGFVLKSPDIEIDNTFKALLKEKREELETKIARVLFK